MKKTVTYFFIFALIGIACVDAPDFAEEPYISFENLSRNTLIQGTASQDTIRATLYYEDGDGDLGHRDSFQIFMRDNRDGFLLKYKIPFVNEEGTANGISGEISFDIYSTCCYFPEEIYDPCDSPQEYPTDTLTYDIYIKDRAGHLSNIITTEPIFLLCD